MTDINTENRIENISDEDVDEFQCGKFLDSSVRVYFKKSGGNSRLLVSEMKAV